MVSDTDYKRICWHSRRGMLELDLIMVPFVEQDFRSLPDADQQRYIKLLEEEDTDMFRWFLKAELPGDPELQRIVRLIIERHKARK